MVKDTAKTYDQVIVVGDVHGCDTALQELISKYDIKDEKNLYVLVGDYFDCIRSSKELPEIDLQDDLDFINFIKDKNFNTIIEARKAYMERNNHA